MAKKKGKIKVRDIVTEKIMDALKAGVVPWRRPWAITGRHKNVTRGNAYRGINVWLLEAAAASRGYERPLWLTFNQAKKWGGTIKPEEAKRNGGPGPTLIVFWKWLEKSVEDDDGETEVRRFPMMRYYNVWNVAQVDGIEDRLPEEEEPKVVDPIEAGEAVIDGMPKKPTMHWGGDRACYWPLGDRIDLPERDVFESAAAYYATAFHELAHSTGHEARLGRFDSTDVRNAIFGSTSYSEEELVAEMTAAFVMAEAGIETPERLDNSAAYIASWLKRLADDHNLVIVAAQAAQKAADWILDAEAKKASPEPVELKEAA